MSNKGGSPIELPSLWSTRVQAESLLFSNALWKTLNQDSVGHFLHGFDAGQDTKEETIILAIDSFQVVIITV